MDVFNALLAIDVDNVKKINKINQTLKSLQQSNRSEFEKKYKNSNYDNTVSYFKRELFGLYFNHSYYKSFYNMKKKVVNYNSFMFPTSVFILYSFISEIFPFMKYSVNNPSFIPYCRV